MSVARSDRPAPATRRFPLGPLAGALGLVGFSIAAITFGQATGIGTLHTTVTSPDAIRDISFVEAQGDTIRVLDVRTGDLITVIAPNKDGFIRGALRGLGRGRKLRDVAPEEPYRLILWDDGRLTLSDVATGQRVNLDTFGPTNSGAFYRLLEKRNVTP
jgi:putative photosynthetic complex assembly protein